MADRTPTEAPSLREAQDRAIEAFEAAHELTRAAIDEGCSTHRQLYLLVGVQAICRQAIALGEEADAATAGARGGA